MHLEILLEEPSTEAALRQLLPRIIGDSATWNCYVHQGKPDLLGHLLARLRAYQTWLPHDWRIVVLIDNDESDCTQLKSQLDAIAQLAGLTTRMSVRSGVAFHVLNRLAIEELESWFFGDIDALRAAYPRLSATLQNREIYRDPDAIRGGTWEALQRELWRAGYYRNLRRLPKIEVARTIATHMIPNRNRSRSFQVFCEGLSNLIG